MTTDLEQAARAEAAFAWAEYRKDVEPNRRTLGREAAAFKAGWKALASHLLSDENVERLAQATFEPDGPGGEYTWAEMVAEDPSRADIWRADARKALQAVLGKDAS